MTRMNCVLKFLSRIGAENGHFDVSAFCALLASAKDPEIGLLLRGIGHRVKELKDKHAKVVLAVVIARVEDAESSRDAVRGGLATLTELVLSGTLQANHLHELKNMSYKLLVDHNHQIRKDAIQLLGEIALSLHNGKNETHYEEINDICDVLWDFSEDLHALVRRQTCGLLVKIYGQGMQMEAKQFRKIVRIIDDRDLQVVLSGVRLMELCVNWNGKCIVDTLFDRHACMAEVAFLNYCNLICGTSKDVRLEALKCMTGLRCASASIQLLALCRRSNFKVPVKMEQESLDQLAFRFKSLHAKHAKYLDVGTGALVLASEDEREQVRLQAVHVLTSFNVADMAVRGKVTEILMDMMNDNSQDVRSLCAPALVALMKDRKLDRVGALCIIGAFNDVCQFVRQCGYRMVEAVELSEKAHAEVGGLIVKAILRAVERYPTDFECAGHCLKKILPHTENRGQIAEGIQLFNAWQTWTPKFTQSSVVLGALTTLNILSLEKTAIVGHGLEQWAGEFRELYSDLLLADEMELDVGLDEEIKLDDSDC